MALTIDKIDTAIEKVLEQQEWTVDGVTFRYADLDKLREMRREIQNETNAAARKTFTAVKFGGISS